MLVLVAPNFCLICKLLRCVHCAVLEKRITFPVSLFDLILLILLLILCQAANPGCILEDFVRWHSPPDWTENESGNDSDASAAGGDSTSSKGRLSRRMKKEG